MQFGAVFPSNITKHPELAKLAEDLGYDQAWFYDSQMIYSDVYATMCRAAELTDSIELCTGVAIPTRIAPIIAHSIATVNQLAPGRVKLGLGAGNTARVTMGLTPISLSDFKEETRVINDLLNGEIAEREAEGENNKIKLIHPHKDQGFINLDDDIPIYISALGPKTIKWTGREADGHMTWNLGVDQYRASREILDEELEDRGEDPGDFPAAGIIHVGLLEPGEDVDSDRMKQVTGPYVINWIKKMIAFNYLQGDTSEFPGLAPPEQPDAVEEMIEEYQDHLEELPDDTQHISEHEGYLYDLLEEQEKYVIKETIEASTIVGEPDKVIAKLKEFEDAGLNQHGMQVTGHDPERQLRDFAEKVIDRY